VRQIQKGADYGGLGMVGADAIRTTINFAAAIEKVKRLNPGISEEEARRLAAEISVRLMNRTDVPTGPGLESGMGAAARQGFMARVLNFAMVGKNAALNVYLRSAEQFRRTGDVKGLLKRSIYMAATVLAFGGIAYMMRKLIYGSPGGQSDANWAAWQALDNTVGQIHGASQLIQALQSAQRGGDLRPGPVGAQIVMAIRGIGEIEKSIDRMDPAVALKAAEHLSVGLGTLAGIPIGGPVQLGKAIYRPFVPPPTKRAGGGPRVAPGARPAALRPPPAGRSPTAGLSAIATATAGEGPLPLLRQSANRAFKSIVVPPRLPMFGSQLTKARKPGKMKPRKRRIA
jgi:hypothetical protein